MPLVVLTYPGHFLLTTLTIQSYLKYHTPLSITVIVDDLSHFAWSTYLEDCQQQYPYTIIPTSSIEVTHQFSKIPWIRQQIVKLHLDHLVPYDTWFFTDGDVEYRFPILNNFIPYVTTQGGLIQEQQNNYVSLLLGLDTPGIRVNHCDKIWNHETRCFTESYVDQQVCVSNPPFRTMDALTLKQLRAYIKERNGKELATIHKNLDTAYNGAMTMAVSEWELIANFQIQILKQPIDLVHYPTIPLGSTIKHPSPDQPDYCGTCYKSDSIYSREWWKAQGFEVADRIWNEISKISK